CTSMIIAMGIPHVVISTLDPNPQVAGNGVKILRQHGIKVDVGILEHEGKRLLKKFNANLQKRPFIILKIIQSKDGFIGSLDGQVWLSNPFSTLLSHKWRSEADGIMVGTKTVLVDDPTLTTRYWTGENPIRIVWDNQLILKNNLNIFDNSAQTIVLNEKLDLIKNNISFVNIKGKTLTDVLEILYDHKIYSLIIEGGSATIGSFYNAGLWNEARIITVPKSISKTHEKLIESIAIRGHDIESINLLGDHLQIIENAI
ncbi:MAG TPA: dihydrofolate reductase family protein, partial [Saprospiraceae bacterium]|nr:dihydrofolate reductase family protein [Saprospiraceae bacterium]